MDNDGVAHRSLKLELFTRGIERGRSLGCLGYESLLRRRKLSVTNPIAPLKIVILIALIVDFCDTENAARIPPYCIQCH